MRERLFEYIAKNKTSQPILLREAVLPLSIFPESNVGENATIIKQVANQLPDDELKDALSGSVPILELFDRRKKTGRQYDFSEADSLIKANSLYRFRCFTRNSNGVEIKYRNEKPFESSIPLALDSIQEHGIEANTNDSWRFIRDSYPWMTYFYEEGDDTSFIQVYRNEEFIHPSAVDKNDVLMRNRNLNGIYTVVPIRKVPKNIPTLRDLLIGVVQVRWQ